MNGQNENTSDGNGEKKKKKKKIIKEKKTSHSSPDSFTPMIKMKSPRLNKNKNEN